jgi:hypothetical protein
MNSEWFINLIILKEIKYRLNIQLMNKALYIKFIVLLTSRLLQTNSIDIHYFFCSSNYIDIGYITSTFNIHGFLILVFYWYLIFLDFGLIRTYQYLDFCFSSMNSCCTSIFWYEQLLYWYWYDVMWICWYGVLLVC